MMLIEWDESEANFRFFPTKQGKKGFNVYANHVRNHMKESKCVCVVIAGQKIRTNYENASMILLSLKNNEIYERCGRPHV